MKDGAVCVVPERFAPDGFKREEEDFQVSVLTDGAGKWIIVKDFYSLHYETWTSGPCNASLRRELMPLIGDGDTLVYDFGHTQIRASLKKKPVGKGKTYMCNEIPRALWEAEDDLEFVIDRT